LFIKSVYNIMDLIVPIQFPKLPPVADEYKPMIDDLYRMFIIQIIAQFLFYVTNPNLLIYK